MRFMKWVGWLALLLLLYSCFTSWVIIESKNIVISGVNTRGTNFGKPAYLHFLFGFFFLWFHSISKIWAKRWNLVIVALNLAWALRNFIIISACRDGECPQKQISLYLVVVASGLMLLAALFPDIQLRENESSEN